MNTRLKYNHTILKAAKQAAEVQKNEFGKLIESNKKENISNVVSKIDIKCDDLIVSILKKEFPEYNIISEENGIIHKKSDYTWVVDPLDGTSNYISGIEWFGILIALFHKNKPVAAGAYLPISESFYYAEHEKGAFLNNKKLSILDGKMNEMLFAFSTDYTNDLSYFEEGIEIYSYLVQNCRNVRSTNSLVDMMYVAENKLGGCVNLYTKLWDIAAPYLIITEAGGIFSGIKCNTIEFDLSQKGIRKNYGIIAANNMKNINKIKFEAKKKIDK